MLNKEPGVRRLDNWIESFMEYASFGEAPYNTLFWTGVSTVAGALRRKVWIDMGYFQWIPNFYVILVAPPGIISKSTTANIGINLLRKVDGIKFGPDVVTWPALVSAMADAREEFIDPATGEFVPQCSITIASDEFGNFLNPQDREMVDILVALWDGKRGTFDKMTKTSGNDQIVNPWINIIACTTPAWISGNFPEYMIGGGFTSRCVFVYAEEKRQFVAYPKLKLPTEWHRMQDDLIHDLEIISTMVGEMELTKEAYAWGEEWYTHHWNNKPEHLDTDQFAGYLARKQTHMHKLAMILSAARTDSLSITKDHLEEAHKYITTLEADMPRVFQRIGQTPVTRGAGDLRDILNACGPTTKSELFRKVFRTLSYNDFQEALLACVSAGYAEQMQKGDDFLISPVAVKPKP